MTMRLLAALLILGSFLTACGAPLPCTDPLGCLVIPPDSPIVIGVIRATMGENAAAGSDSLLGVKQAVEEKGMILGHKITLVPAGTDCSVEDARLAATNLVADPSVFVAIGPTCTAEMDVTTSILTDAGVILLTPASWQEASYLLAHQILSAIEQVARESGNHTLFIPRHILRTILLPQP